MPTPPKAARLAIGFGALVGLTTALIILGSLVRAHGAGLACPDWPLCFGQVIPEFDVKVAFEWSHRVLAGGVGLLYVGLSVAVLRAPELRARLARRLALGAFVLALQALLGALTVWELLAQWTVTSHLLTGNLFNVVLLSLALGLWGLAHPARHAPPPAALRRLLWGVAALLLAQMTLGGLVSSGHAGLACPEWPTCNGGEWFPAWRGSVGLHLLHRMNGYALGLALVTAAWVARDHPGVRGRTALAAGLGLAQLVVGVLNVVLGIPIEVTGLHSAIAAGLILCVAASLAACYNAAGLEEER